ncbi:MAG: hypothetical protein ACI822_002915, partial [Gammaproteobacteria bacterium]
TTIMMMMMKYFTLIQIHLLLSACKCENKTFQTTKTHI